MFVSCPSCGAENREDSQYCNLCFNTLGFNDKQNCDDIRDGVYYKKTLLPSITERAVEYMNESRAVEEGYALTADLIEIGVKGEITGPPVDGLVPYTPPSGSWFDGVLDFEQSEPMVFQENCEYPDYPYLKRII